MKLDSFFKVVIVSAITLGSPLVIAQSADLAKSNVSGATSNYQLLLEIRGLQREVAELRDRIDQQEFQLENIRKQPVAKVSTSAAALPKKVHQFEGGGAVVEEIDLSNVFGIGINSDSATTKVPETESVQLNSAPITGSVNSNTAGSESVLATEPNTPSTNVLSAQVNDAATTQGEAGGVFGPLSNNGLPQAANTQDINQTLNSTISVPEAVEATTEINSQAGGAISTVIGGSQVDQSEANQGLVVQNGMIQEGAQVLGNTQPSTEQLINDTQISDNAPTQIVQQPVITTPESQSSSSILESGDFGIQTTIGEEELYSNGLSELKKQNYEKAVSVLSSQLSQFPKGTRAPDAYYWIGESLYIMERLESAKKSYMSILNLFPENRRIPNAIYKVAVIEYEQGNTAAARAAIKTLHDRFPSSSAAEQAKTRFTGIL